MKTVAFITVLALGACVASAQPGNDNCASSAPILLGGSPVTGSTTGANTNMTAPCVGSFGADVWYHFTAPYSGTATASTCTGTNFDTVIVIRTYPCGGTVLACNDDNCVLQSSVSFPITFGAAYQIQLGGYAGATGTYALSLTGVPAPVSNDTCATAIGVGMNVVIPGNNAGATVGPDPTPYCANTGHDVWYSFVAPWCGAFNVNTCVSPTNFDTTLGVWQGSCGALNLLACSDDEPGCTTWNTASNLSFNALAGVTYRISVGGFGSSFGTFGFIITPTQAVMALTFPTAGLGTIGLEMTGGPPNGTGFFAVTTTFGNFPNGWFLGIDITMAELVAQWVAGYPFVLPLDSCGHASLGPVSGLPSGFGVYAVGLGFPPGSAVWSTHSSPQAGYTP